MKRCVRQLLALFLCLALCVSLLPAAATADGDTGSGGTNNGGGCNYHVTVSDGTENYEVLFFVQDPPGPDIPITDSCGWPYTDQSTVGIDRSFILAAVDQNEDLADDSVQDQIIVSSISFDGRNVGEDQSSPNWGFTWAEGARACGIEAPCKAGFSGVMTAVFTFNGAFHTVQAEVFYLPDDGGSGPSGPVASFPQHVAVQDGETSYEVAFFLWDNPNDSICLHDGGCGAMYAANDESGYQGSFRLAVVSTDFQTLAPDTVQDKLSVQSITLPGENVDGTTDPLNGTLSWTSGSRDCVVSAPGKAGFTGLLTAEFTFNGTACTIQTEVHYLPFDSGPGGPNGPGQVIDWRAFVQDGENNYEIEFTRGQGEPVADILKSYCPLDTEAFLENLRLSIAQADHSDDMQPRTVVTDEAILDKLAISDIRFEGGNETEGQAEPNWDFSRSANSDACSIGAPCGAGFSGTLTAEFTFNGTACTIRIPVSYQVLSAYLSFTPEGSNEEQFYLVLDKNDSLCGSLKLYVWDDGLRGYTETPLTYQQHHEAVSVPANAPVSASWDEQQDLLTVAAGASSGSFSLSYADASTGLSPGIGGYVRDPDNAGFDTTIVNLTYEGQTVTVGAGFIENGSLSIGGNTGEPFEPGQNMSFYREFVLGALVNHFDQENEDCAPKDFFKRIMSCEFHIVSCTGTKPTTSTPVKRAYLALKDGAELFSFTLQSSVPSEAFEAELAVTFSYKPDGWQDNDPLLTYMLRFTAFYEQSTNNELSADDLDTTAKLNDVLANKAAFGQYLQNHGIDFAWDGYITIFLPAVDYAGKVECDILEQGGEYGITLCGTSDPQGGRTTMHALEDRGGLIGLDSIVFTADGTMQSYGTDGPFSCGVLVACSGRAAESAIQSIDGCSFSGFEYAVRGTATGYPGNFRDCTVTNCTYGLYVDCPELNATVNVTVARNTFRGCAHAICIPNLPSSISAYIYRIRDNVFLGSTQWDLDISQPGTFFCYGNYFGTDESNRRTALLLAGARTTIIANPCRLQPNSPLFWIDPQLPTEILNSEAASIAIAMAALTGNQNITIKVVSTGSSGLGTVGVWTFGGNTP